MKTTKKLGLSLAIALACTSTVLNAQDNTAAPAKLKTMQDVLDASQPADWRTLDPNKTVYMELASGRVIIELAPTFAPEHSKNIVALAKENYFDGLSINRSHDNFVVQWGDPEEDEKKRRAFRLAKQQLPAEFVRKSDGLAFTRLPDVDGWAQHVGFVEGMPAASNSVTNQAWLTHWKSVV